MNDVINQLIQQGTGLSGTDLLNFWTSEKISILKSRFNNISLTESKKEYQAFLLYMQMIEVNELVSFDSRSIPEPLKELVVILISLKLKHRDLGIRQYLHYLQKDTVEYKKTYLLSKIRSYHTTQEILKEFDTLLNLAENYYSDGISGIDEFIIEIIDTVKTSENSQELKSKIYESSIGDSPNIRGYFSKLEINQKIIQIEVPSEENETSKDEEIEALKKRIQELEKVDDSLDAQNQRSFYQIDMIFGDMKSVKGYKRRLSSNSGVELIESLNLTVKQFGIVSHEYHDQQKMNLSNRMIIDNVIILAFETDHNTDFYENIRTNLDYTHRINICGYPKQHFSISRMESMLTEAINKYERYNNNSLL